MLNWYTNRRQLAYFEWLRLSSLWYTGARESTCVVATPVGAGTRFENRVRRTAEASGSNLK